MENKKMRIGINASFLRKPNTGIGQVTLNFLKKLSGPGNREFEFILYLEEDLPKGVELPQNFSKRVFLPFWKRDDLIRKIWWEKFLLPEKVKKDKCDVFISLYQSPTILPRKIKHIMLAHDIIPRLFPEYLPNFRKRIYQGLSEEGIKKATRILSVSRRTEKDIIQHLGVSEKKISVNYIDVEDKFKKKVSQDKNKKVLKKYKLSPGYIFAGGGVEVRKNVEGVIRAYKFLHEKKAVSKFPKLVIYGKLMPELVPLTTDVEKIVRELNLSEHVKTLGAVPQEDLPALFSACSMFVYPSLYEGFGLPVLEAMSQGKPVITSKVSSLPEVGLDAVLYCHPYDVYDIAMVMKNVLSNENLRDVLSLRAKERSKDFSWSKFTKKIIRTIENLR